MIAHLSQEEKEAIPCGIVFARTGGGLIDFSIALSVTEQGEATQKITPIAGKPLELIVKPCERGQDVKGYVVFRARILQESSLKIPSNSLFASLMFAYPVFAHTNGQPFRSAEVVFLL